MAYETKALLIAIANIMRLSNGNLDLAYKALAEMANAEGVILEPLKKTEGEKESK